MSTSIAFDIIAKDRASDKFDKVGKSADRSSGNLKKFAKVGALAIGAAAVVAGKALFDMTKAAIEDEAAQKKLAQTLRNSAGATGGQIANVEKWISAQGRALGVADDDLRPALQRLTEATGDVGEAQKLASLAMDVSAGTGKSLKTVSEALMKAQNGQISGLSRLGIETKNAKGETLTFEQATKKMADTFNGQASVAANTTEGKFKRLKLMFDETKETIGAKLIPVATKLAGFLVEDMLPAASKLGSFLSEKLGPTFSKIGGFITGKLAPALRDLASKALEGVRGMFENVSKSMESNRPFIDALVAGLKILAGFIVSKVMPALGWFFQIAFPAIGKAIGLQITVLSKLSSAFLGMAANSVMGFRHLLNAALATFSGILNAAEKSLGWVPKLGDKIRSAKKSFDKFKDGTIANLDKTAAALERAQKKIDGIHSPKPIKIGVLFQLLNKLPKGATLAQYAHGTNSHPGGLALVGEEGPEIVDLPRGSRVHTASASQRMAGTLSGPNAPRGGGGTTVIEIRSGGSKLDDALVELLRVAIRRQGGNVQAVLGRA